MPVPARSSASSALTAAWIVAVLLSGSGPSGAMEPFLTHLAATNAYLMEASGPDATLAGTLHWRIEGGEGIPALVGTVHFPDRRLKLIVRVQRNTDPSLPSPTLFNFNFKVPADFPGGPSIAIIGLLTRDDLMAAGEPVIGASARFDGSHYLFATSGADLDRRANAAGLIHAPLLGIAIVYADGRQAVITLDKTGLGHVLRPIVGQAKGGAQ